MRGIRSTAGGRTTNLDLTREAMLALHGVAIRQVRIKAPETRTDVATVFPRSDYKCHVPVRWAHVQCIGSRNVGGPGTRPQFFSGTTQQYRAAAAAAHAFF